MKNFLTFRQLDYECLHQCGLNENDIAPAVRRQYISNKLMKLYQLKDGLNDPFYNFTAPLTVSADIELLKDTSQGGTISVLEVNQDGDIETITRTSGTFTAGSLVNIVLWGLSNGNIVRNCVARIIYTGATTSANIITGSMISFVSGTYKLGMIVNRTLSVKIIDVSNIYLKDITKIWDDKDTGGAPRVFKKITDPNLMATLHKDPFFVKEVAWYHRGDIIELFTGASSASLGNITMEYRGKPAIYTEATENTTILIPPEDNQILFDEVVATYLAHVGKAPPEDVNARLGHYQKMYEAAAADKAKLLERKFKER